MPAFLLSAWAWFTGTAAGRVCLALGAVALALLGLRSHWRGQGKAETEAEIREEAADARDRIDAVPEPGRSDVDKRLRDGKF